MVERLLQQRLLQCMPRYNLSRNSIIASVKSASVRNHRGFTLIELVSIIVILGIISVTVAPRFMGRSGFAELALRDEIIAAFRFAQQRAMYDQSGNCYRVVINSSGLQIERNSTTINSNHDISFAGDYQGLAADVNTTYFDGLGNAYTIDCPPAVGSSALVTATTINITGGEAVSLQVHPTGYIQQI